MERLKRRHERYDEFSASAVITDSSGAQVPALVSDISPGGCRLMANRTFPIAAEVRIRILGDNGDLEGLATVVHSSDAGTGVMFGNLTPDALFVLQKWLAERATCNRQVRPKLLFW
jgi:PilZ domain